MAPPEGVRGRRREAAAASSRAPSARTVALRAFRRVTESGAYSNLTLAAELERSTLDPRDRALAADLLYGALRRKLQLDRAIAAASARPLEAIDAEALAILRLGAYQVLFSRVPAHAAVSESVNLAGDHHRGFVNAVLRNVARTSPDEPTGQDDEGISARTGLSEWAVAELRRVLPAEEVEPAAVALASRTDLSIRTNTCRVYANGLEERLNAAGVTTRRGRHRDDVLRVGSAVPSRLPGFEKG
ncbi:MAG TPA: transcription antitermination factor NusB, partial [Actinomycetota bacterium]|nr:transcription antitermination factor NusB [Actinomycetota bacterium]